jgi:elongation factor 1-beta
MVVVEDEEGGTEQVEENFSKLQDIASIEVVDVRRLM